MDCSKFQKNMHSCDENKIREDERDDKTSVLVQTMRNYGNNGKFGNMLRCNELISSYGRN